MKKKRKTREDYGESFTVYQVAFNNYSVRVNKKEAVEETEKTLMVINLDNWSKKEFVRRTHKHSEGERWFKDEKKAFEYAKQKWINAVDRYKSLLKKAIDFGDKLYNECSEEFAATLTGDETKRFDELRNQLGDDND